MPREPFAGVWRPEQAREPGFRERRAKLCEQRRCHQEIAKFRARQADEDTLHTCARAPFKMYAY